MNHILWFVIAENHYTYISNICTQTLAHKFSHTICSLRWQATVILLLSTVLQLLSLYLLCYANFTHCRRPEGITQSLPRRHTLLALQPGQDHPPGVVPA